MSVCTYVLKNNLFLEFTKKVCLGFLLNVEGSEYKLFVQLLTAEIILCPQNRRHCRVLSHIPFSALISCAVTLIICEEKNYTERYNFLMIPWGGSKGTPGGLQRTGKLWFCLCFDIFRWCNYVEILKKKSLIFYYFFKKINREVILLLIYKKTCPPNQSQ